GARAGGPPDDYGDVEVLLRGERLTVGRGSDQDVCIPDRKISSAHALIERDGAGYRIRDLGSTNGTYVNGRLVEGVQALSCNDELLFGNTRALYTDVAAEDAVWPDVRPSGPPPPVDAARLPEAEDAVAIVAPQTTVKFSLNDIERDIVAGSGERASAVGAAERKLHVLYGVTQATRGQHAVEDLATNALALVLEVVDADQAAVFLTDGAGRLEEVAFSARRGAPTARGATSRGVLAEAVRSGEALITRDAQEDERFVAHQSIHTFNIRSVLAVPMRERDDVLGVLYLDKREAREPFGTDDLQLAAIVAQQLAAAVANARLIEALTRTNRELAGARDEILRWNQELEAKVAQRTHEVQAQAAQISALSQEKDQLLGMVAHDLRTPLTGVLGLAEVALSGLDAGEQVARVREDVSMIRSTALEMSELLADLLDVSRIEAGKLELEKRAYPLALPFEQALQVVRPQASRKKLELRQSWDPALPELVLGDPVRLRQVLVNLLSNAVKFSDHGWVEIRTTWVDGSLRVEVEDTGIGILEEDQARLFMPFIQVGKRVNVHRGTGLGLALCRRIVEAMGGRIGLSSRLGKGSVFWFEVPLREPDAPDESPPKAVPAPAGEISVLVAEDNDINRRVLRLQLQRLGYSVQAVTNGREAVEALSEDRFDLVLMDCQMPEMDGLAATREIRSRGEKSRRPVIVALTAHASADQRERCMAAGMDDFIAKPVDSQRLVSTIRRWVPAR
ncbi:MAG: response regulator, partial [Armatimonadetes bacterium]|nr:response regulator [Armatimonadota bacterium]